MHELSRPDFDVIRPLFCNETGNDAGKREVGRTFVAALLEGNHQGRVFVDNKATPSTVLVALACEFLYVAGRADDPATNANLRRVITDELLPAHEPGHEYAIIFPTSGAWEAALAVMFCDAPALHHAARHEFEFSLDRFQRAHAEWRDRIPEGFALRRYDRALAEGQGLAEFWGSLDAFLERGFGFGVIKGDEVVSRCHTVMIGAGEAEINIETAAAYRRQGFATLAACAFIEHCLTVDLEPAWSCWDYNVASHNLAERLGFVYRGDTRALVAKIR